MITLTLYGGPDCELCERLLDDVLAQAGPRARVEVVDISGDFDLKKRFGLRIPVLAAGDVELSGYPLDTERLELVLAGGVAACAELP